MRLKDLREDNDLLQKDIAKVLNVAERTYSGYETETRWIPKDLLIRLAKFYNTSTDYILELTNIKKPYPYSESSKNKIKL
jgi:transcriptional regulator with XRE-family HTH domain